MGERTNGLNAAGDVRAHDGGGMTRTADEGEEKEPRELEHEIELIRGELGTLVGELDRRRHDAFDLKLQLRRHAGLVAIVGAVVGISLAAGIGSWIASRRRREQPLERIRNLAHVLAVLSREPEKVERLVEGRPEPGTALLTALAKIASTAGQRAVARAM